MLFSQISFIVFHAVSLTVFCLIIIKSGQNYKKSLELKSKIIGKGAAAFLIWCAASGYVFVSQAVYSIGASHSVAPAAAPEFDQTMTELIILQIVWVLLGVLLVYWVSLQSKVKLEKYH